MQFILEPEQFGQLHIIDENHVDMQRLYDNVREIVSTNQFGPRIYLYPIYTYYSSLLSDKIKLMTERIFEQDTIPKLPVNCKFKLNHFRVVKKNGIRLKSIKFQ